MTEFFGPWSEDGGEEGEEVTTVEETVETFTTTTKKTRSVPVRRRHLVLDRDLRKRIFVATYLDSHDFKFRDLDFLGSDWNIFIASVSLSRCLFWPVSRCRCSPDAKQTAPR